MIPATTPTPAYYAYIDEAGDTGITRVTPIDNLGGTEWLTLGAVLIRAEGERASVDLVRRIRSEIKAHQGPDLHYRKLSTPRKLRSCEILSQHDCRCFVVASNKKNMRGHRNPQAEAMNLKKHDWFYNYCIRLLIERISIWAERRSISDHGEPRYVKLIFSKRGGVSYRHIQTYIELLVRQSYDDRLVLNKRKPSPRVLDHRLIEVIQHNQNAGLQLADIVASSFYQAAHAEGSTTWDTGPAKALKPRMARERDVIADFGVCLQPTPAWRAELTERQKEIFRFYGYSF